MGNLQDVGHFLYRAITVAVSILAEGCLKLALVSQGKHGEDVHHITFAMKGMDGHIDHLTTKGVPRVQKGDYIGGRYCYLDGAQRLDVVIELLEDFR